jgi:hypothetical protein
MRAVLSLLCFLSSLTAYAKDMQDILNVRDDAVASVSLDACGSALTERECPITLTTTGLGQGCYKLYGRNYAGILVLLKEGPLDISGNAHTKLSFKEEGAVDLVVFVFTSVGLKAFDGAIVNVRSHSPFAGTATPSYDTTDP